MLRNQQAILSALVPQRPAVVDNQATVQHRPQTLQKRREEQLREEQRTDRKDREETIKDLASLSKPNLRKWLQTQIDDESDDDSGG